MLDGPVSVTILFGADCAGLEKTTIEVEGGTNGTISNVPTDCLINEYV